MLCCAALRRLNYRLNEACEADIELLCAQECSPFGAQACGGRVLRCLTEKQDSIKSKVEEPRLSPEALAWRLWPQNSGRAPPSCLVDSIRLLGTYHTFLHLNKLWLGCLTYGMEHWESTARSRLTEVGMRVCGF